MVKHDSSSLTARQRARKATEDLREKIKRQESALAEAYAALDQRAELDTRVGRALRDVVAIEGINGAAGDLLGLTAREVGAYLRAADEADKSNDDEDKSKDDDDSIDVDTALKESDERATGDFSSIEKRA